MAEGMVSSGLFTMRTLMFILGMPASDEKLLTDQEICSLLPDPKIDCHVIYKPFFGPRLAVIYSNLRPQLFLDFSFW